MIWLHSVLSTPALVDNSRLTVTDTTLRLPSGKTVELSPLDVRGGGRKDRTAENSLWGALHKMSRAVETAMSLGGDPSGNVVFFGRREYEHNTRDPLFTVSGSGVRDCAISTGNLVGSVWDSDCAVHVGSRFGDAFLRHIVAGADGFLPLERFGGHDHEGSYRWLLAYLWTIKLQRALRLGLPKVYVSRSERLPRVRGNLDLLDYALQPKRGMFQCTYREHCELTPAIPLFIKAYELLRGFDFVRTHRSHYHAWLQLNSGRRTQRRDLLNTPDFRNPFYADYNPVIELSKRVILSGGLAVAAAHQTQAFLFDVSMLFEYFIRKQVTRSGVTLCGKADAYRRTPRGSTPKATRELQPDLVWHHNGKVFVFDVKYKRFDPVFGVKREDLFQLHTYIGQYGNDNPVGGCGFIYPYPAAKWGELNISDNGNIARFEIKQQGRNVPFYCVFFKVPDSNEQTAAFESAMEISSEQFRIAIASLCHSTVVAGSVPLQAVSL